ncbi:MULTISPECIES: HlyD family secretion protein [unclassified Kaistella]|uniref:HlyD family secretion protein n=1 Tax=unclassified Kaistella TaxID=2762626 RepID=UPI002737451F|nr:MULTISPECIES: HlyD family secretion protein [unclassified Kaistella]MDP2453950.1 HlyD family secretion protein [Kaistella sp. SH11-4b]MDP2457007.1 HlyD family secretion protein [Kaistella sp. SH40-3]MDP2459764.1 HlyD family secretion protein [Kaistella sp. SH19-2b]
MENKENTPVSENTESESHKATAPTKVANPVTEKKVSKNKSNKLQNTIANAVVFIVVAFGFYWLIKEYFNVGKENYTESAQVQEFINPINSRVAGYIKEIKFKEHQAVKKGDTLVILDDREIETQLAQAEAAYQNTLAQRNATNSSINTVSSNISVLESNIAGQKARLWNAEQNLKRYQNLLNSEAVTRQQYDQVKTEYDATKASYQTLLNQRNSAQLSTSEVKTRIGINDAEIKRAKAALDMARINLSYAIITAPYDGVMGRRLIADGQLIQGGQQIATIVLDGEKWVTANFLESQMPEIEIGKKILMKADALGGKEFEGTVTAISAATGSQYSNVATDNSTGNFVKVQQRIPVRIEFTNNNKKEDIAKLRAGMNMNVTITPTKKETKSK